MNIFKEIDERRTKFVQECGLVAGDFIKVFWYDCWCEVQSVYDTSCVVFKRDSTEYTFFSNICWIHRANDPWDHAEVRSVNTAKGSFGGKKRPPVPDQFLYHGTYTLKPWLWNYCGKNVLPKKEMSLDPFAEKAGVEVSNVPWDQTEEVIKKLKSSRIKGWFPHCSVVPEQKFEKTIAVK